MKAKKLLGLASILLMFSGHVIAGVPTISDFTRDFDIGTLTSTPYVTAFSGTTNFIQHSYTFDLDAPATIEARVANTRVSSGYDDWVTALFRIDITDSSDRGLYKGETISRYPNGSTFEAIVTGELPAGKDYYVLITGEQVFDFALEYMTMISAFPSAVSEPETYALMLVGLGLIGFMARRKQSKTK